MRAKDDQQQPDGWIRPHQIIAKRADLFMMTL
jgi:hypothetical protein